jgi:hypothetical protein
METPASVTDAEDPRMLAAWRASTLEPERIADIIFNTGYAEELDVAKSNAARVS